jgi:hypothetical protein
VRATVPARNRQVCQFIFAKADSDRGRKLQRPGCWTQVRLQPRLEEVRPASALDAFKRDPGFLVALTFGLNGFQHQFFCDLADRSAQRAGRVA